MQRNIDLWSLIGCYSVNNCPIGTFIRQSIKSLELKFFLMFQVSTAKQSQRYSCWVLLAMIIGEVGSLHSKKLKQWMGMIHIEVTLCRNCPAGKIKNKSLYAAPGL